MKRGLILIIYLIFLIGAFDAVSVQAKPLVLIQYHLWYQKGDCQGGDWGQWAWWSTDDDPCTTRFDYDWMREISSPGYPLIGPYDSSDPEVMRWHIRLAKAAGVDGFLVSIFYFDEGAEETFEQMLAIAKEEDFKIGIEGWTPNEGDEELYKQIVIQQIDNLATNSPNKDAFLRINGKPVYMFNYYGEWMSDSEFRNFLDSRQVFWIVEDDMDVGYVIDVNNYLSGSSGSEMHSAIPGGASFFVDALRDRENNGVTAVATSFPGFDERMISNEPGRSYRSTLRNLGQTVLDFLTTSEQEGADVLVFLSFNDWNEYSMFEPGYDIEEHMGESFLPHQEMIFDGDPYRYLKILADFKGKTWVTPEPNCSIVDDLILEYNPYSISCYGGESCGDRTCDPWESCSTCETDCGTCPVYDICDSLGALYHLDGNANDDSTNSNNGIVNGPAIISSQPGFNQAYNFDGVNDYIQVNDPGAGSVFDLQGDFTVSAWVKFDTFTNDESSTKMFPRIIQKGTDISDAQAWSLDVDTYTPTGVFCDQSNVVHFMASVGGTKHSFCGTTTLQTGTWYHIAVVRSGSSLNMYLDGNPNSAGSFGSTANIDSYDEALYIGEDLDNPDGAVDGVIDEVAIWNRALSDSEISDLRNSGAPVDCGSSSGSSCNSGADTGGNSVVEITELINFIGQWKTGTKAITQLINAIGEWKAGCN